LIGVARGNLTSARTQQANLQSQAADYEREGRQVPAHLLAQIDNQKAEQEGLKSDILRYQAVRKEADNSFIADSDRLKELLSRNQ
jgi:hypothetical protein